MTDQVLIGLAGLVLSVLTYFAGVWRTEKRHAREDSAGRVKRVSEKYMEFRRTNLTGGYDSLQKAGMATFASNAEVQEVLALIVAHGENHPLGSDHQSVFQGVDLLKLFKFAAERQINFLRVQIQDIIRDSGARAP